LWFKKSNRDIDNALKTILDAFQGIYYEDDMQIRELHVIKTKCEVEGFEISINILQGRGE
jgi:Holliday junction resolvase RusA-like endonuclease